MTFKVGDQIWRVHFHHSTNSKGRQVTRCQAHTGPCVWTPNEPKYCAAGMVGEAICSKKDQFDRSAGRFVSFSRAIRELGADVKKQLWDQYWERHNRPTFSHRIKDGKFMIDTRIRHVRLVREAKGA